MPTKYPKKAKIIPIRNNFKPDFNGFPTVNLAFINPVTNNEHELITIAKITPSKTFLKKKKGSSGIIEPTRAEKPTTKASNKGLPI